MCEFLEMIKESYTLLNPSTDKFAGYRGKNFISVDCSNKNVTKVVHVPLSRYIRDINQIETLIDGEQEEFYLVWLEGDIAVVINSLGYNYGIIDAKVEKKSATFSYILKDYGWELSESFFLEEKTILTKKLYSYITYNGGSWLISLRHWWKDKDEKGYYEYD